MIGITSMSVLSKWERGLANPGIVQVFRLARIYGVLPHELYEGLWNHIGQEIEECVSNEEPIISNQFFDE
jgi:transcriptional regulator with XRE-family HTH domain